MANANQVTEWAGGKLANDTWSATRRLRRSKNLVGWGKWDFGEEKNRQEEPNETFVEFRWFFAGKRNFWTFQTVRNRLLKLLGTSDGFFGPNETFGHF